MCFSALVDGVIGGDDDGPACPDAYSSGVILAGHYPVAVDSSAARLMGSDPSRLPQLAHAFDPHSMPLANFPYDAIRLVINEPASSGSLTNMSPESTFHFRLQFGWVGQIEYAARLRTRGFIMDIASVRHRIPSAASALCNFFHTRRQEHD